MTRTPLKPKIVNFLSLFTSTGTLLCCALPAAIASVAGGSAVISLLSSFPWLIPLSRNKGWIFLAAGVMLIVSGVFTLCPKGKVACAVTGGRGCDVAGRFTKSIFWSSVVIYATGGLFAYMLSPLLKFLSV